jgi:hypothetical protein
MKLGKLRSQMNRANLLFLPLIGLSFEGERTIVRERFLLLLDTPFWWEVTLSSPEAEGAEGDILVQSPQLSEKHPQRLSITLQFEQ